MLNSKPRASRPLIEPMLPLINVVFLLLVFFMVAGNTQVPLERNINIPQLPGGGHNTNSATSDWLYMDQSGELYFKGEIATNVTIANNFSELNADPVSSGITLYADKNSTGDVFTQTLQRLAALGVSNVNIVSERYRH